MNFLDISVAFFSSVAIVSGGLGAQEVTLPLERYEALRAATLPTPTPKPTLPRAASVDRAGLSITVDGDSARIVQDLELTVAGDGWQEIPLPSSGTFLAVDLGNLEGRVSTTKGWALTVRGIGRWPVRLESVVPLPSDEHSARPLRTLALELPAAAVVDGFLHEDGDVEEVFFVAGCVDRGRSHDGGWRFAGIPGEELRLNLLGEAKTPQRSTLPLAFTALSASLAEVARTRTDVAAWLEVQVVQGSLDELRVEVPEGLEVESVEGDPLAGWLTEGGVLHLTPLAPIEGMLRLRVRLTGAAAVELASPHLVPQGARRPLLASVVRTAGDGLLELVDAASGRLPTSAERGRLPSEFVSASPNAMVVTDRTAPPRWQVTWPDAADVLAVQVDRMLVNVLAGESGRAAYQAWFEVRNTGATALTVSTPPGYVLTAAARDGSELDPGDADGALVVPLRASPGRQVIHIAGLMPLAVPAQGEIVIPMPALSAPATRVEAAIVLPDDRRYRLREQALAGPTSSPPAVATRRGPSASRIFGYLESGADSGAITAAALFPEPAEFTLVEAAWSSLSTAPRSVVLDVVRDSESGRWF